jgi:hypothetical protein
MSAGKYRFIWRGEILTVSPFCAILPAIEKGCSMTYPGGKGGSGVVQQIINQIPPHLTYIEPFLGSGTVMRAKRPALVSIGVDLDPGAADAARAALPGCTVICRDAISFLESYNWLGDGKEFVYCDPPYLFETRSCKRPMYTHEFGEVDQHLDLLRCLRSLPLGVNVALSGYWSALYEIELDDWRIISYTTRTRGGRNVREWLWMNYSPPAELHDYRYLGDNFRQRERVARIRRRWLARLGRLDQLERYALLSAFDEYRQKQRQDPAADPASVDLAVSAAAVGGVSSGNG